MLFFRSWYQRKAEVEIASLAANDQGEELCYFRHGWVFTLEWYCAGSAQI